MNFSVFIGTVPATLKPLFHIGKIPSPRVTNGGPRPLVVFLLVKTRSFIFFTPMSLKKIMVLFSSTALRTSDTNDIDF